MDEKDVVTLCEEGPAILAMIVEEEYERRFPKGNWHRPSVSGDVSPDRHLVCRFI